MTLAQVQSWAKKAHQNAVEHGFWEGNYKKTMFALMHAELSEALESHRKGEPALYMVKGKPEGWAVELIDCVIRILDYIGGIYGEMDFRFLDLNCKLDPPEEPATEQELPETILDLHDRLTSARYSQGISRFRELLDIITTITNQVRQAGCDPMVILRQKHRYNQGRPYKHGKSY